MKSQRPRYIDLHTHTEFSDGVSSPEHLARVAALQELDLLAITDHDKVEGYERCKREGAKWGLQVIPGVEISTDLYHILGLGINPNSSQFREFLDYSAQEQKKVATARIEVLRKQGIPITLEKLIKTFPESRLGKCNIFMTMLQDEECRNYFINREERLTDALYKKCLKNDANGMPTDRCTAITPERAIREIHEAGGIAIIAHPFKEIKDTKEMDELLNLGIDGLEIQPNYNGKNEPFRQYAKEHGLLITYGSDWHAGLFGRAMLDGKGKTENSLDERLADALNLGAKQNA